jgi:chemotaxis protein methyltransferase WspC
MTANIPMAFACRKRGTETAAMIGARTAAGPAKPNPVKAFKLLLSPNAQAPAITASRLPPRRGGLETAGNAALRQFRGHPTLPPPRGQPSPVNLEEAFRLANAGKLKEASLLCETHLRQHGASAQAWYLLGLVRDAGNDASSIDCYRKALYLEPNHYESLLQMALLAERNGDAERARTFRNRAERLKRRELVKA